MVMEPKYLAFRRWLYTPIIIWQGDWIPRDSYTKVWFFKKRTPTWCFGSVVIFVSQISRMLPWNACWTCIHLKIVEIYVVKVVSFQVQLRLVCKHLQTIWVQRVHACMLKAARLEGCAQDAAHSAWSKKKAKKRSAVMWQCVWIGRDLVCAVGNLTTSIIISNTSGKSTPFSVNARRSRPSSAVRDKRSPSRPTSATEVPLRPLKWPNGAEDAGICILLTVQKSGNHHLGWC